MSSWDRIMSWCRAHAPATAAAVLPPAEEAERWRAERETGGWPWPDAVDDFYQRCNGLERSPAGYLLPDWRPLPLDEVVETWEMLVETDATTVDGLTRTDLAGQERKIYLANLVAGHAPYVPFYTAGAGTPAGRFLPPWLPIAEDMDGNYLLVDRRIGDRYGSLVTYDKVDADHDARRWSGLPALLTRVADAMDRGEPIRGGDLRPVPAAGRVSWQRGVDPERSPRRTVVRYFDMWNTGDTTDAAVLLAPTWRDHSHPEITGPADVAAAVERSRHDRPQLRFRLDAVLGDDDLLTVLGAATTDTSDAAAGTDDASGRPADGTASLAWVVRLDRGRLAEMWTYQSSHGFPATAARGDVR